MIFLKLFLPIFYCSFCLAQSNSDTLHYTEKQRSYFYSFSDTTTQYLLFDTITNTSPHGVEIKIFNNSEDTIRIMRQKPQDNQIMWLSNGVNETISPNSVYVLNSSYRHSRPGPFQYTIRLFYSQNNRQKQLEIITKGFADEVDGFLSFSEREELNKKKNIEVEQAKVSKVNNDELIITQQRITDVNKLVSKMPIYDTHEYVKLAEPKKGLKACQEYIKSNINWDRLEKEAKGTVYIEFVIEIDGSISLAKSVGNRTGFPSLEKEAIRIVTIMPDWIPAEAEVQLLSPVYSLAIRKVRTFYVLPIVFKRN